MAAAKMTMAGAAVPPKLEIEIGQNVRALRQEHGLTVAELCAAADLSTGMLSKIENGAISPSLTTLGALARALNVTVRDLLEADDEHPASFVKAGHGSRASRRGTKVGHQYVSLIDSAFGRQTGVEPYLITLDSESVPCTTFRHSGHEVIYLLSGRLKYRHGHRSYVLEPGDTLIFDAAARHGPEQILKSPTTFLSLATHRRDSSG